MAESSQVEMAARAVHAALDFQSSQESRSAATAFLESVGFAYACDIHVLWFTFDFKNKRLLNSGFPPWLTFSPQLNLECTYNG
jgi:hypothetical protein